MADDTAQGGVSTELPKGLAVFRRLLQFIGRTELVLAIVALLVVIVLSAAQAALRYTVSASLWWAQEVAETTIMIAYFLGASYIFKTRQYIVIEFVSSIAPMRLQMVFYLVAQVLALAFSIAILWLVYLFLPTMLNMTTPVLKLPGYFPPAPLIAASAMIALTSVYYLSYALWAISRGSVGASLHDMEEGGLILKPLMEEEPL